MFLLAVVIIAIALVLLMPTPAGPMANGPSGLDEFDFPTADSSRSIPELYGTLWMFGNLIWYGGLSSQPQKMCS